MGGPTNCLHCSIGWDAHLHAGAGSAVSKKLKAVANSKGYGVAIRKELFRVLDEAGEGRVTLVVLDSS